MRRRLATSLLLAAAVAGCGGGDAKPAASTPKRTTAVAPKPRVVELELQAFPRKLDAENLTLRGTVTPGAALTVNGKPVAVTGGRFRTVVQLAIGKNRIRLTARKPGLPLLHKVIVVKRKGAAVTPASPYRDQAGNPAPNPNCPAGTAPDRSGGCVPYNENNPPPEPKVNDPACYEPNPPPKCF